MPAHRETYDFPKGDIDPVVLIRADDAAKAGATTTLDGTMLHIDWPDPRPLEEQRASVLAELPDRRWAASQRFTFQGFSTPCDTAAATNVLGAVAGLQLAGGAGSIRWKLDAKTFRDLGFADLVALGQAMRAHVQACFDHEAELVAAITKAEDAEGLDGIDIGAGWPV